jgi:Protein of unknown function (DUF1559)
MKSRRSGFTLSQLIILLALLALFLGFMLSALARVRKVAAQTQSQNNMKQILIGTINMADAQNGKLPAGVDDMNFSVAAKVLPYIEENELYKSIDFTKSVDDKVNAEARKKVVRVFVNPADTIMNVNDWGATNYLFNAGTKASLKDNDGVFYQNSQVRFPAGIPDGTSNTIFIVETLKGDGNKRAVDVKRQHIAYRADALKELKAEAGVEDFKVGKHVAGDRCASWMDGRFLQGTFNAGRQPNDMKPDVTCGGMGGWSGPRSLGDTVNVGLGDGSVRAVSIKISAETWKAAITPNGGEVLGSDW